MAKSQGKISDICDRLDEAFRRLVPLQAEVLKGRKKPSEKEIKASSERALQQFLEAARAERMQHGLGAISRARVAFSLQQRLLKAGYPSPLVKQVLFSMLTSAFVGDKN